MNCFSLRRTSKALSILLFSMSGIAFANNEFATIEHIDMENKQLSVFDAAGIERVYRFTDDTVFSSGQDNTITADRLIPSETVTLRRDKNNILQQVIADTQYVNQSDVLRERRLSAANKKGVLLSAN